MATADFAVSHNIADAPLAFTLGGREKATFEFHLPKDVARDLPSVLSFMVHTEDADDLRFKVEVNDRPAQEYAVNSEVLRGIHEIVGPNVLEDGERAWSHNSVQFRLKSGDGTLRISDVVLWFQRGS